MTKSISQVVLTSEINVISGFASKPMELHLKKLDATQVVPLPANGSTTNEFALMLYSFILSSIRE